MTREMPTAAIVLSGNELLDGRVCDGNGVYASADLSSRGVKVMSMMTVADDAARLTAALGFALAAEPDLLIVGGGLGTTHDDLTAACLAEVLDVPLAEDPTALAMLEDSLRGVAERRRVTVQDLLPRARQQARLPRGSAPLAPAGVAPGIAARRGRTRVFAFPGVPHEFRSMWREVVEALAGEGFFPEVVVRHVRIFGCGEPAVEAVLEAVSRDLLETGITVGGGEVTVKLRHLSTPLPAAQADEVVAALEQALPVFSTDGRTIDDVIADLLGAGGESLAVAESCTGGALGGRITGRPGSSRFFRGGVISYADAVKQEVLGVSARDLQRHGAVSNEVAVAMAEGVRRLCGASYGLSVTGVAGPGGATPEKPVGLVCVGCSGPRGTRVSRGQLHGDRAAIRLHATTCALHLLREDVASGPPDA